MTMAPKRWGLRVSMLPVSKPPLEPLAQPSSCRLETPRRIRSAATASKSSYACGKRTEKAKKIKKRTRRTNKKTD